MESQKEVEKKVNCTRISDSREEGKEGLLTMTQEGDLSDDVIFFKKSLPLLTRNCGFSLL